MNRTIDIAALREDPEGVLARVAAGERLTVVDGERALADLAPSAGGRTLQQLVNEGRVTAPTRPSTDFAPVALPGGGMTLSEALDGVRG